MPSLEGVDAKLLATLDEHDDSDAERLRVLRSAVDSGVSGLDIGSIEIEPDALRDYLRERGRLATERASIATA